MLFLKAADEPATDELSVSDVQPGRFLCLRGFSSIQSDWRRCRTAVLSGKNLVTLEIEQWCEVARHGTARHDQERLAAAGVGSHGENNWGWCFDARQVALVCFGL